MAHEELSYEVVGACMRVHAALGPGLLESVYGRCVALELSARGLRFDQEQPIDVRYRGCAIDNAYRVDFVVEDTLLLELKAVSELLPIHQAQLLSYLRLTGYPVGLLINFNVVSLRDGIRRLRRTR